MTCIQTIRTIANELRLDPGSYVDIVSDKLPILKEIGVECIARVTVCCGIDAYAEFIGHLEELGRENTMCRAYNFHETGKLDEDFEHQHAASYLYRHGYHHEDLTRLLTAVHDDNAVDQMSRIRDVIIDITSEPSTTIDLKRMDETVMNVPVSIEDFRDVLLHETVLKPIDPDYHSIIDENDLPIPTNQLASMRELYRYGDNLGLFPVDEVSRSWRNYNLRRIYHILVDQKVASRTAVALMQSCLTRTITDDLIVFCLKRLYYRNLFSPEPEDGMMLSSIGRVLRNQGKSL